jgi:adiponectin receptor
MEDFKTISDQELIKINPLFQHHINPFIYSGFRIPTFNYQKCLLTIFYLHNESVNIWSHVIAFFLFIGILIKWTYQHYSKAGFVERFASLFLFSKCINTSFCF